MLHMVFPAHAPQAFVNNAPEPAVLMRDYRNSWDAREEPILAPTEKEDYSISAARM